MKESLTVNRPAALRGHIHRAAALIGLAAAAPAPAEDPAPAAAPAGLATATPSHAEGPAPAADWPQFLGPNRSGSVEDSVAVWPSGGPEILWRRPAGDGFSGIAVAGGRAYTLWTEGRREYLFCLDADDGSELWRLDTGGKYFEPQGGNGPRSTPAVAGDHVYALGATGRLVAVHAATGEVLWSADLPSTFGGQMPRWGFSGSPLVEGDLLLVETAGGRGQALGALNRFTGEVVWSAHDDPGSYSSPVAADLAGVRQAVFFMRTGLVAVAPADGRLLWRREWETPYDVHATTPLVIPPDGVFISSGYDKGAALVRVTRDGEALKAETAWTSRFMCNRMATSVYAGGHLYGFDGTILKCIAAATGAEAWKARGYGEGTLIRAGDMLVVLSDKGALALVRADPKAHQELARTQVLEGKRCWTAPTLARDACSCATTARSSAST